MVIHDIVCIILYECHLSKLNIYVYLSFRNRIKFLLQLINLLADPAVSYLCTVSGPGFLLPDHYSTLISHLNKRECIGLKTLYIRVRYVKMKKE